jgi:hypothetical protein
MEEHAARAGGQLHEVTAGWPQRPGFASTRELLGTDRGGDVDLTVMPPSAVAACGRAWAGLAGVPEAVVHGDPGARAAANAWEAANCWQIEPAYARRRLARLPAIQE